MPVMNIEIILKTKRAHLTDKQKVAVLPVECSTRLFDQHGDLIFMVDPSGVVASRSSDTILHDEDALTRGTLFEREVHFNSITLQPGTRATLIFRDPRIHIMHGETPFSVASIRSTDKKAKGPRRLSRIQL